MALTQPTTQDPKRTGSNLGLTNGYKPSTNLDIGCLRMGNAKSTNYVLTNGIF